jgi:hypothetical protein
MNSQGLSGLRPQARLRTLNRRILFSAHCDPYVALRVPLACYRRGGGGSGKKFAEGIDDLRYDQDAAGALV